MSDEKPAPTAPLNAILLRQLEPPIQMLLEAIDSCPDDVWDRGDGTAPVWQHGLHATYYLQKWIRLPDDPFRPPAFVDEAAVEFIALPQPAMHRDMLRRYLQDAAEHCRQVLQSANNDMLLKEIAVDGKLTLMDTVLGQIRHTMYHVGCISTILRRYTGKPLPWRGY